MPHNPRTTKSQYFIQYGSGPYRVLCYARFRKNKAFTASDYGEFSLNRLSAKSVDAYLSTLVKEGYIEKLNHPDRPKTHLNGYSRYMYIITLRGHHELTVLGRKQRERQERFQRQNATHNGLVRWRSEQRDIKGLYTENK